jgi:hypothetical protein
MLNIKAILKRTVVLLNEKGEQEKVKEFREQATEFVKFIVKDFKEFTFYTGEDGDATGSVAFSYTSEKDKYPIKRFLFLTPGLV